MSLAPHEEPFERFRAVFERARVAVPVDPNAALVATATPDGRPSARVLLMKGFDTSGFTFFTNFESRKGGELLSNPRAAVTFYWAPLEEQVRFEGTVERVPDAESDAYFQSRARGSQLGAWASKQSRPLASREELEERVRALGEKYAEGKVPRPPHWGGFKIVPTRMEFWHARPSRLHDREEYVKAPGGWEKRLVNP